MKRKAQHGKLQHKKPTTQKMCNLEREQYEKSATRKK